MNAHKILWPSIESMLPGDVPPYVDIHGILEDVLTLVTPPKSHSEFAKPSNILLNGHHGLGKSLLAANVSKELEKRTGLSVPMVTFDCSEDTFELSLMGGSRVVAGGETPFVPGPFPTAIHLANETGLCVLCVEEISALTPGSQKVVNRLTDWRTGLYVPDANQVFRLKEGSHLVLIATMNPSGYGGVYSLNDDLRSRFDEIHVKFPAPKQEAKILRVRCPFADRGIIDQAIRMAADSRSRATEYSLSTRDLVRFISNAHRLRDRPQGLDFALEMIANKFEGSDRDTMVDRIKATFDIKLDVS